MTEIETFTEVQASVFVDRAIQNRSLVARIEMHSPRCKPRSSLSGVQPRVHRHRGQPFTEVQASVFVEREPNITTAPSQHSSFTEVQASVFVEREDYILRVLRDTIIHRGASLGLR